MTSNKLDFLTDDIQALKNKHLYQELVTLDGAQGTEISIGGKRLLNFSSNNYLGLCTHPSLKKAAKEAIDTYGVGAGAVRTIIGTLDIHQQLEQRLAEFKGVEATLVFQSGFLANTAAITSILSEGDVIISDALNHASIIDGIRMTRKVDKKIYAHSAINELEQCLKDSQNHRRRLIVTDGVFSMDGDLAKLPAICDLADRYNAIVMVDDAHGSGVFSDHGEGTVAHFGLHHRVDIVIGTMSKAIGAMGGYVACTQAMREVMINKARPFLFSTPHPPSVTASCLAAIELLMKDTTLIKQLWYNTRYMKNGLESVGFTIDSESPILPIIAGSSEKAVELSKRLYEAGIFARPIVFPTVALDKARVRLIVTAPHTQPQLDHTIESLAHIGKELGIISQ